MYSTSAACQHPVTNRDTTQFSLIQSNTRLAILSAMWNSLVWTELAVCFIFDSWKYVGLVDFKRLFVLIGVVCGPAVQLVSFHYELVDSCHSWRRNF